MQNTLTESIVVTHGTMEKAMLESIGLLSDGISRKVIERETAEFAKELGFRKARKIFVKRSN